MPQGEDGIVGVWLGMYAAGNFSWRSIAFYEDGTYRFSIPRSGFHGFDKARDKIVNQGDNLWGTYDFDGAAGSWIGDATLAGRESKIKLEADGSLDLGSSYSKFYRCRSVDGFSLDGSYTSISGLSGDDFLDYPNEKPLIRFRPDGTFLDEGLFFWVHVLRFDETEDPYAPGDGTYEARDFTLLLRYSDGRTRQIRFNFPLNAGDASNFFMTANGLILWKIPEGTTAGPGETRPETAAEEKAGPPEPATLALELGEGVTLELARVPAGSFLRGSPEPEEEDRTAGPGGEAAEGRFADGTRHEVTIGRPFYMGIHPVTQAQYEAVTGENPSWFGGKGDSPRRPVEMVTWHDAMAFCEKLSEKTGRKARLPTEAEWEYACRAGTVTAFHTGDRIGADQANCNGGSMDGGGAQGVFRAETTAAGSFPANAWGLHDMHGNVWEWVSDWHGAYPAEAVTDPKGPEEGDARVLRGGSWGYDPWHCRSAVRDWIAPDGGNYDIGFRVALD